MRKYGAYGKIGPARGFTWDEVRSGDGVLPGARYLRRRFRRQGRLLNKLRREVRKQYGGASKVKRVRIDVNSWYRTGAYNATLPGAARFSQHVAGRATDINVTVIYHSGSTTRLRPYDVASIAERVRGFARGGIGVYDKAHGYFTHLDHRPDGPARWLNG